MSAEDPQVDQSRRDLIEEFRRKRIGRHSPDLRLLLNRMRMSEGKRPYILICTKPHREWCLGRKSGARGSEIEVMPEVIFHSPEEAEWEIFKRRWQELTGETLT